MLVGDLPDVLLNLKQSVASMFTEAEEALKKKFNLKNESDLERLIQQMELDQALLQEGVKLLEGMPIVLDRRRETPLLSVGVIGPGARLPLRKGLARLILRRNWGMETSIDGSMTYGPALKVQKDSRPSTVQS